MNFAVWAPHARAVDLVLHHARIPMTASRGGWHRCETDAGVGDDYGFSLDGGPPRPDPRSRWQPHGIHGLSRVVDATEHEWQDSSWKGQPLADAVVYELHIGTFTEKGTFASAIDKLDHLVDLGIDAVEVMPVNEFSGRRGWGYDGVGLWAPHHCYGGPAGFKRFVDECHRRNLAVVLDVVYNHLGPSGNYLGEFGPYFTDRYRTPWGDSVNLDGPDSDEVRTFFIENAVMWLRDYHVDGLRLDAVHALLDTSALHLVEEICERVEVLSTELGREMFVIAESDLNDPRVVRARDRGGYGATAQWSDDFHHALHAVLTGERQGYYSDFGRLGDVATAIREAFVYAGRYSPHRRRRHGRSPAGLAGDRFLAYLQNHDQVGNRANGERSGALMSVGRLKIAAALVLTSPFIPMLFQGEEWAATAPFLYFTDHEDPDLGRAVSEGRRREFAAFGWADVPDPQDASAFLRSKLDWDEGHREPHAGVLAWHRRLIALRRQHPGLRSGRLEDVTTLVDEDAGLLVVGRGAFTVACNIGTADATVPVPAKATLLAASETRASLAQGLLLPPESVAVVATFENV